MLAGTGRDKIVESAWKMLVEGKELEGSIRGWEDGRKNNKGH